MSQQPPSDEPSNDGVGNTPNPLPSGQTQSSPINSIHHPNQPTTNAGNTTNKAGKSNNLLTRLTISEWLTFIIAASGLIVNGLTYRNALDTSDLKNAVEKLTGIADAAHTQAQAAQGQLTALVEAQRAWVYPTTIAITSPLTAGLAPTISVNSVNVGREPAQQFWTTFNFGRIQTSEWYNGDATAFLDQLTNACITAKGSPRTTTIVYPSASPLATYSLVYDQGASPIPGHSPIPLSNGVLSGDFVYIVKGCFTYNSVGKPRHSAFCFYYHAGQNTPASLSICPIGNQAD